MESFTNFHQRQQIRRLITRSGAVVTDLIPLSCNHSSFPRFAHNPHVQPNLLYIFQTDSNSFSTLFYHKNGIFREKSKKKCKIFTNFSSTNRQTISVGLKQNDQIRKGKRRKISIQSSKERKSSKRPSESDRGCRLKKTEC